MSVKPALIGKAGEVLVAGELLRRDIEVAYPASDVGIDLLAYRLIKGSIGASHFVPIQVKARARSGFNFQKSWFEKVPGVVLVHVWNLEGSNPEFYILDGLAQVEEALGPQFSKTASWCENGKYNVTKPGQQHYERMQPHRDKWHRIIDQLTLRQIR